MQAMETVMATAVGNQLDQARTGIRGVEFDFILAVTSVCVGRSRRLRETFK